MVNVCFDLHPLTEHQQRIWYMEMLYPNSDVWMITAKISIPEPLDFTLLERSINLILEQRQLLRTRIVLDQGENKQYIPPYEFRTIPRIDPFSLGDNETWTDYVDKHPIHLHSEHLIQFYAYEGEGEYGYIVQAHHIICDGLSFIQLINEITEIYHAQLQSGRSDRTCSSPPLDDYISYLESERQYLASKRYAKDQIFWKEKFRTMPEWTELKPHNPLLTNTAANRKIRYMDHSMYVRLQEFCHLNNVSIFTFFSQLWRSLYTNSLIVPTWLSEPITLTARAEQTRKR